MSCGIFIGSLVVWSSRTMSHHWFLVPKTPWRPIFSDQKTCTSSEVLRSPSYWWHLQQLSRLVILNKPPELEIEMKKPFLSNYLAGTILCGEVCEGRPHHSSQCELLRLDQGMRTLAPPSFLVRSKTIKNTVTQIQQFVAEIFISTENLKTDSTNNIHSSILLLGSFMIFLCSSVKSLKKNEQSQEKARGKSGPLFHFDVHEVLLFLSNDEDLRVDNLTP